MNSLDENDRENKALRHNPSSKNVILSKNHNTC
uniref:Uncharacterized protein n=1 Tax=Musa acuminata subsp. malaccensis TaxID=214687 RepID=A0A804IJA2_MUSAM